MTNRFAIRGLKGGLESGSLYLLVVLYTKRKPGRFYSEKRRLKKGWLHGLLHERGTIFARMGSSEK